MVSSPSDWLNDPWSLDKPDPLVSEIVILGGVCHTLRDNRRIASGQRRKKAFERCQGQSSNEIHVCALY